MNRESLCCRPIIGRKTLVNFALYHCHAQYTLLADQRSYLDQGIPALSFSVGILRKSITACTKLSSCKSQADQQQSMCQQ